MKNYDWLSEQEQQEVAQIAREQNKTFDAVIKEMIEEGLKNFFEFRGTIRHH